MTNLNTDTGDVEMHLARRIVALRPTDFRLAGKRNLWTTFEPSPDGAVGVDATTVELITGRNPGSNTDSQREFDLQILLRFDTALGKVGLTKARKAMAELCDALHRSGEFTDAVDTAARYVQIIAIDVPVFLENRYFAFNVTLMRDG